MVDILTYIYNILCVTVFTDYTWKLNNYNTSNYLTHFLYANPNLKRKKLNSAAGRAH